MSSDPQIELCPETGICSIIGKDNSKVDLMPDEVEALRRSSGNAEAIKRIIADCDDGFAAKLEQTDVEYICQWFS